MARRGRPPKATQNTTKHYTKEELEKKKKAEEVIKKNKNKFTIRPPSFLVDKKDIKLFKSIAKELNSLGLFTEQNQYQLGNYIRNINRLEDLQVILDKQGYEIYKIDKMGNQWCEPNPFLKTIDTLENRIMKQESILGINTADRLKYIQMINENSDDDEKDEFNQEIPQEIIEELKKPFDEETLEILKELSLKYEIETTINDNKDGDMQ